MPDIMGPVEVHIIIRHMQAEAVFALSNGREDLNMRIAQLLYNKAHWIFETEETMEQLKARFVPDIIFVDITNYVDIQEGWDYDSKTGEFSEPVEVVTKDDINAEYLPQFEALQKAFAAAQLVGDTISATAIQSDYQALITEYNAAMEAATNGE